jgi:hypothetical protein
MKCEIAQQNIILAQYGELPDELQFPLEQHLHSCEECRREWNANLALHEDLALSPLTEPSPNLLAAARMHLDEALDALPPRTLSQSFWYNASRWFSFMHSAPALTTLLVGVGFLGGNVLTRYQEARAPKTPPVMIFDHAGGPIASVSGIVQTPNSDMVQVEYNRLVPETAQGSLDDPQIRQLLMLGTKLSANNNVHAQTVGILANECRTGQDGDAESDAANQCRTLLLGELRYDEDPNVRMTALHGLQPYVAKDERVRDAVLETLMRDKDADVRGQAVSLLRPVQADSSVRQVLRTVSAQDANPAIRNASFQVLQGAANIE